MNTLTIATGVAGTFSGAISYPLNGDAKSSVSFTIATDVAI